MRALVFCLVLGCGGGPPSTSSTPTTPTPAPAGSADASATGSATPVAAGSGVPAPFPMLLNKLDEFEKQMCDCFDSSCVTKVTTAMEQWSQGLKAKGFVDPKLTQDQVQQATAVSNEMNKCAKRASNMSD